MGVISTTCPHCRSAAGMHTFGVLPLTSTEDTEFLAAVACPVCERVVGAHLIWSVEHGNQVNRRHAIDQWHKSHHDSRNSNLELADIWPKLVAPSAPADIPETSARAYLQAERNFMQDGNEDAAGSMYRRALEIGLKAKYPAMTGTLASRINELAATHVIPNDLARWAHEIRSLGNDSVHEIDGISRAELEAMRAFTDTVLRYLFTLPAQVASRHAANPP